MKFLKKFQTNSDRTSYEGSNKYIEPYVSLVKESDSSHYNKPFLCKLTLNDGSSIKLYGNGQLTSAMTSPYKETVVSAKIGRLCTSIGSYTFSGCTSLTSISIPSGVTSIGSRAFDDTPWWNSYSADTDNHYGNIIYINDVAYKATAITITSVAFKENTVSIGGNALAACASLSSINIPSSVTIISDWALASCTSLSSINIPNSVTIIGDYAFRHCHGLTSVAIPYNVTSIGIQAFYGCSGFTSVLVQATTPPTLGGIAFDNTNNCPIYVPSESLEAYKAATNWVGYASRIQSIT